MGQPNARPRVRPAPPPRCDAGPRYHGGIVLSLGRIAHDGVLKLWRERGLRTTLAAHPFAHGAVHRFEALHVAAAAGVVPMADSFHVGQLTTIPIPGPRPS